MLLLPFVPADNDWALASIYREEVTGLTTTAVSLSFSVAQTQDGKNLLLLFKNGTLLPEIAGASGYSVTGTAVTLGSAAIAGDRFVAWYYYRTGV